MFQTRAALAIVPLAMLFISVASPRLSAECITVSSQDPVRHALRSAAVVFFGTVESVEVVTPAVSARYRVRFGRIEAFKGPNALEQTLEFAHTAESFLFETGQRVLLYANVFRGDLTTQCTRTRLSGPTDDELREIAERPPARSE